MIYEEYIPELIGAVLAFIFLLGVLIVVRKNGSKRKRKFVEEEIDPLDGFFDDDRVFGNPGGGLVHAKHFSQGQIEAGIEGEVRTARILDEFVKTHDNVYVFHSLIWPDTNTQADVDHALVCGDTVLFLDTKNWKATGEYSFDWSGNIRLNNKPYKYGNDPKIVAARNKYHDFFKKHFGPYHSLDILSAVVIHNEGSTIGAGAYGKYNKLVMSENLEDFLKEFRLDVGIVKDNRKLLKLMQSCLKA